ncbi:hypothetical protein R3I94_011430 [Phoxinus phoxinus]
MLNEQDGSHVSPSSSERTCFLKQHIDKFNSTLFPPKYTNCRLEAVMWQENIKTGSDITKMSVALDHSS